MGWVFSFAAAVAATGRVAAAPGSFHYLIQGSECPPGEQINTSADCEAAARALGLPDTGATAIQGGLNVVYGCYLANGQHLQFFDAAPNAYWSGRPPYAALCYGPTVEQCRGDRQGRYCQFGLGCCARSSSDPSWPCSGGFYGHKPNCAEPSCGYSDTTKPTSCTDLSYGRAEDCFRYGNPGAYKTGHWMAGHVLSNGRCVAPGATNDPLDAPNGRPPPTPEPTTAEPTNSPTTNGPTSSPSNSPSRLPSTGPS